MKTLRPAVLTVLAALGVASAAASAQAAGDSWRVPAKAKITVKGHGFGHGHGMSQYGAEGAAREGLSYEQIVDFYYDGTTWGTAKGRVNVLITSDTSDDVVVLARKGLGLRDRTTGKRTELPDNGATRWRIVPDGAGSRVAYLTRSWHLFATLKGEAQFAADGRPITLVTPAGNRSYRGALRSAAPSTGSAARDTVNRVRLDDYVKGVVPLEMPALWSPAAVRAQAVAARTYAAYERAHPHGSHYQICDTSSCQVYGGVAAEHPASNAAVDATRHRALTSGGEPAFTQFGASSGGWTSAGSVPYLPARKDPYDGWSGNPVHTWSVPLTDVDLERTWPALGNLTKVVVTDRDGNGDWGGRVRSVTLVGSDKRVTVSGDTFRAALGLRSTWLTFRVAERSGRATPRPVATDGSWLAADLADRHR
ncbi:SpoIID/LytB domain-containing protein [Nocardioides sp. MAHUQ-72]|uniref:SpoIID/LytB domain-containing protein n=1 Tax=unclassified Nocardioides TaxID=2615069 RepID=UPI003612C93B